MSSDDGNGGGRRRRSGGGDYEVPSSSRQRGVNEIWPEPFVEALATQVAINASISSGRLSVAQSLNNVFQVCSTWRAVSRSDLLWRHLTRHVWGRTHLTHATWRDEYIYRHRTATNFRTRRYDHFTLQLDPSDVVDPDGLSCRCLALSDRYLSCGFADGTVRLFDLTTRLQAITFRPHRRDRFGRFSRAVSGMFFIAGGSRLVFASMDGDIHVGNVDQLGGNSVGNTRRAHSGDVVNNGALIDFSGCQRWWVGLYAGVPGQAFNIWNGSTEELVYIGGSFTDPESVMGWHTLTELTVSLGRVRVTSSESAIACTSSRILTMDLINRPGLTIHEEENQRGLIVATFDLENNRYLVVDNRGVAMVRRVDSIEVCRFRVARNTIFGCLNLDIALMCADGVIRTWETNNGEYLYNLRERVGEVNAMVTNERHVAVSVTDNNIQLWDFGAQ